MGLEALSRPRCAGKEEGRRVSGPCLGLVVPGGEKEEGGGPMGLGALSRPRYARKRRRKEEERLSRPFPPVLS